MRVSVKCVLRTNSHPHIFVTFVVFLFSVYLGDPVAADGLAKDVGRALDRLADLPMPFTLVPGVRIVKRAAESGGIVRRRATVLDAAENMFQRKDLVLDAAPGLQMRLTALDDGRGFKLLAQPDDRPGKLI